MGLKLAAVIALVSLLLSGLFYWYYTDSQQRIATLTANNAKVELAIQQSEAAIVSMQNDILKVNVQLKKVNSDFAEIRAQNTQLAEKLDNVDLGVLAINKPKIIERIINTGTKNAARCFEILSGGELTINEKEAKDAKTFNNECPWLWPGNNQPTKP
jgi:chromosome segregation ATPase